MESLLEAVRTQDRQKAAEWSRSEPWATVEQLISASSSSVPNQFPSFNNDVNTASGVSVGTGPNNESRNDLWTCPYCTFLNSADFRSCEMCSLPRYFF